MMVSARGLYAFEQKKSFDDHKFLHAYDRESAKRIQRFSKSGTDIHKFAMIFLSMSQTTPLTDTFVYN